ncbi:MAG: penicillin-binding protein 1C [Bacteroidales bacterium]|nr:penicillin-binding protein 1C [Bacteroidales bacterium]
MTFNFQKKHIQIIAAVIVLIIAAILLRPKNPFEVPYSMVVTDSSGTLLSAHIAKDGQWRFAASDSVPYKFQKCIICCEDKRFFLHPGVDIFSLLRAAYHDIKNLKIVSGGSTITMQTIRLSRNKERTFKEKIIEIFLALRLELGFSKDEILQMYSSHAPFGGNTVGLETAAQRYFGRPAYTLSWAEAAMLAVLPNNPALIHLSRNREKLLKKRNSLLDKLLKERIIDEETCELSKDEPIPEKPSPYPELAPHLLTRISLDKKNSSNIVKTTLDYKLQSQVINILNRHVKTLRISGINNGAVLVLDVKTGNVLAYVGNSKALENQDDANDVDIITSYRSTGSVLKPFLYCAMLSEGELLPKTLVPDLPTQISGYMPKNYRLTYDGAVSADKALARSLNVPAVKMLQQYGGEKFISVLNKLQISSVNKSADYYGLSLILGGCEASLWQLCGAYASMARCLYGYEKNGNKYEEGGFFQPNFYYGKRHKQGVLKDGNFLSAGAIYLTLKALTQVERPEGEQSHEMFSSDRVVAWKTGTSFGFRDAWAIGVTGNYVVGVWTGNADGEGRPDLIGIRASAPILFDVIKILPKENKKFPVPYDDLVEAEVCKHSGYLAGQNCGEISKELIPFQGQNSQSCPYCHLVYLDREENFRVTSDKVSPEEMVMKKWFTLPPAMEYYYKKHDPDYKILPPLRDDCKSGNYDLPLQIIYPEHNAKIFLPKGFDGKTQAMVMEAAVRNPDKKIYWNLDEDYLGMTLGTHKISTIPSAGKHVLLITDEDGNTYRRLFEIMDK